MRRVSGSFSKGIWVLFMDVFKVWFLRGSIWVFRPCMVQLALYWKISKRQNSTHLVFLKHQQNKTSLYKLSKNHRVIALFEISRSVRRKLQSTVPLDHPVGVDILKTLFLRIWLVKQKIAIHLCNHDRHFSHWNQIWNISPYEILWKTKVIPIQY